jgi:hypothetical protein
MKPPADPQPVTEAEHAGPSAGSWLAVAAAWIAVGVPLLWGVYMTVKKAALLFR